jgi:hypothetical protein
MARERIARDETKSLRPIYLVLLGLNLLGVCRASLEDLNSQRGVFAPVCFEQPIKRLNVPQGDVLAEVTLKDYIQSPTATRHATFSRASITSLARRSATVPTRQLRKT